MLGFVIIYTIKSAKAQKSIRRMYDSIKITKGLDLPLGGEAERRCTDACYIDTYAMKPTDFVGLVPRLMVSEGDSVEAGQPLVSDKNDPRLTLPSPVSGIVKAIVRGEKRRLEAVVVERSKKEELRTKKECTEILNSQFSILNSPCWWMIKERPFGTIANPDHKPKGIYVSLRDTYPLAPDMDFVLKSREQEFEAGIKALGSFAEVHCVKAYGPHPAGNVGTIIAALDPINKGEYVWTVNAQDVANIGHWCLTGKYRPERVIAVAGPAARNPHYYRVRCGVCLESIIKGQLMSPEYPGISSSSRTSDTRIISGDVLCGEAIAHDGFLGAYNSLVTLLPEGNHYDFMGWLMPGLKKYSFSRTFLSGFMRLMSKMRVVDGEKAFTNVCPYKFDTNIHGSVRPLVFTGNFEQVFPFDIYPLQLIKACIIGDVEMQEKLGIYEVEPEDFALCEFIDTSKTEIQSIIREALEKLRKEGI